MVDPGIFLTLAARSVWRADYKRYVEGPIHIQWPGGATNRMLCGADLYKYTNVRTFLGKRRDVRCPECKRMFDDPFIQERYFA